MIKLFRKIRQKLLSENKFSKYLIYAIGEIVLVVIGILIALQINNWNENRKADINQLKYLNLLKKEALKNISNIDIELDRIKITTEGQKDIFQLIDEAKDTLSEAHISQTFFNTFSNAIGFNYENSVLTEIKNSGELKNIKNDSLRTILLALEPRIHVLRTQEDSYNTLQKNILEYINLNGDMRLIFESVGYSNQLGIGKAKVKSKGNTILLSDSYFKNKLIEYMAITNNLTDQLYPSRKKQFVEIITVIEEEIESKN
tara:strand:+ start:198 stop:971 length:774 start_codon:yes stop_codon:yes gene_type:complete